MIHKVENPEKETQEEKREPIINLMMRRINSKMMFIEKFEKYEKRKKWRKRYIISEDNYYKRKNEIFKLIEYKDRILNAEAAFEAINIWKTILKEDTILMEARYYAFFENNITFFTQSIKEYPDRAYYAQCINLCKKCMNELVEGTDAFTVILEYQKGLRNTF